MAGGALRDVLARFGFDIDESKLKSADAKVSDLIGKVKSLAVVAGAGIVLRGINNLVDRVADAGEEIRDTSVKLGVSAAELQAWRFAAKQAGTDVGALSSGFGLLQKNAFEAANGSKEMAGAFAAVGVNVKNQDGSLKGVNQLLLEVGEGLHNTENESERTALAMRLLGRSGKEFKPLFEQGAAGVQALFDRFKELGGGIGDDVIAQADELKDKEDQLAASVVSAEAALASKLIPTKLYLIEVLTDMVSWLNKSPAAMKALEIGTKALAIGMTALGIAMTVRLAAPFAASTIAMIWKGVAATIAWGKAMLGIAAMNGGLKLLGATMWATLKPFLVVGVIIAGFIALYLLIEDFVGFLQGKQSVIGDFLRQLGDIDTIFPKWKAFKDTVAQVVGFIGGGMADIEMKRAKDEYEFQKKYGAEAVTQRRAALDRPNMVMTDGGAARIPMARAPAGTSTAVSQTNGGTSITINGSKDPRATGMEVKKAIEQVDAQRRRQIGASLVPKGGV